MARSELDFLKDHIDGKVDGLEDKYRMLNESISSLKNNIPQIARDQAESTIAKTAFIKPAEKWSVAIALLLVLFTAFGSYGKLSSMMDRFERLEGIFEKERVLQNIDWVSTNKATLPAKINHLIQENNRLKVRVQAIESGRILRIK